MNRTSESIIPGLLTCPQNWRLRANIDIFRFWKRLSRSGKASSRSGKTPKSGRDPRHATWLFAKLGSSNPSRTRQYILKLYKACARSREISVKTNPFDPIACAGLARSAPYMAMTRLCCTPPAAPSRGEKSRAFPPVLRLPPPSGFTISMRFGALI